MSKPALTAIYFVLTFVAGIAVGSWGLWIYLIGFPSQATLPAPVAEVPSSSAPPASVSAPSPPSNPEVSEPSEPAASAAAPPRSEPPALPSPKGHWDTVDVPGRSHEECLALTKELNDAYKDCRFGVHKDVWVAE